MRLCDRCGTETAESARFCQSCGAPLATVHAPNVERKLVSVLFIDMVGSTARAEGADPEDVRDVLDRYQQAVREQIERYGGTIEKFIGDAVVAVFGAPRAQVDDAERAVRCALRLLKAIDQLNASDPSLGIAVRIAVTTGEAVVALGTEYQRGESLATGDVLNTAARLQSAAPPGGVVVASETYLATRRAIRYEPLPEVTAKGKRSPIEAWLAIAPAGRGEPRGASPMVGRERELEELLAIFHKAGEEHRPHLVTVFGPPGIGKSRLAAELASHVEAEGGRGIHGRCLPYEEQGGYQASIGHVKQIAGILETDAPQVARDKLLNAVAEILPDDEVPDVSRYLSLLLGLGVDEPSSVRQPLFFAMRRLIEGLSQDRSCLVVFEDLHWADRSQLELLEYLAAQVRDARVLFLGLARPEFADQRSTWGAGAIAQTTIPLESLSPADAAGLLGAIVGPSTAPAERDRLVDVAGGNPLFIEELAASTFAGNTALLPSSLREVIGSRIDALPAEDRTVLLDASVIGRNFWRGVLTQISPIESKDLDRSLDALAARDLIHYVPHSHVEGDIEFSFKHVLIREVAYGTLPRAVRRARHGAVARYIESGVGADIRDLAPILAHHWRQAGEALKAVDYLLIAAERARDGWAEKEAVALYEAALELVGDKDPALRTRIRWLRGLCLVELTDFEAGAAELDEILPDLSGREEFEAVLARARMAYWLEEPEQAYAFGDRSRELAERLGDRELVGPAILYQATARYLRGELDEALALGNEARDLWVPGSRLPDLAALNDCLAQPAYWVGEYSAAEHFARSSFELGGESHSIEPVLHSGGWLGLTLAAQGRTEEAIKWLDSMFERSQDLDPRWGAAALNYSSLAFRDMCMFDEARRRNERALEIVSTRGAWGMPEMQAEIDLMFTNLAEGDIGSVQRSFPTLWVAAVNGKAWRPWLGAGRLALVRAELARQVEGPEATVTYAQEALDRARRVRRRKYVAAARAILGSALVQLGQAAQGVAELKTSVVESDRLGSPAARWQLRVDLAKALYGTGDDDGAALAYREAAEVIRMYATDLSAEHAAAFLAAEPVTHVLKAAGRQ